MQKNLYIDLGSYSIKFLLCEIQENLNVKVIKRGIIPWNSRYIRPIRGVLLDYMGGSINGQVLAESLREYIRTLKAGDFSKVEIVLELKKKFKGILGEYFEDSKIKNYFITVNSHCTYVVKGDNFLSKDVKYEGESQVDKKSIKSKVFEVNDRERQFFYYEGICVSMKLVNYRAIIDFVKSFSLDDETSLTNNLLDRLICLKSNHRVNSSGGIVYLSIANESSHLILVKEGKVFLCYEPRGYEDFVHEISEEYSEIPRDVLVGICRHENFFLQPVMGAERKKLVEPISGKEYSYNYAEINKKFISKFQDLCDLLFERVNDACFNFKEVVLCHESRQYPGFKKFIEDYLYSKYNMEFSIHYLSRKDIPEQFRDQFEESEYASYMSLMGTVLTQESLGSVSFSAYLWEHFKGFYRYFFKPFGDFLKK